MGKIKLILGGVLAIGASFFCTYCASAQPVITNQPSSQTIWPGGVAKFTVLVSNTGGVSYQWQHNGTNLPNGIITTIAGKGSFDFSGDGSLATNAGIYQPMGLAIDTKANLYVGDSGNSRVRKINAFGIIATVAGNGTSGYSGDGSSATNAMLSSVLGMEVDKSGNFYFVNKLANRIRKVDASSSITTIAGNGLSGYFGDGGTATNASLYYPLDIALDKFGNLLIADTKNNCIRKVDTNGIIQTIAGIGTGGFFGDGGAATNAKLNYPSGLVIDTYGNVFISDQGNNRIRKVNTNGVISTIAGNGSYGYSGDNGAATNASFIGLNGLTVDTGGNLYVSDTAYTQSSRIRQIDTNGTITTFAGSGPSGFSGDNGPATNALLFLPQYLKMDSYGNLFISDCFNCRIRKVSNTQGPVLLLNNVGEKDLGGYQLVATSTSGSVTSSIAYLNWASPLITALSNLSNGSVVINLSSQPSSSNIIWCTTNLLPPFFWQPLYTNLAGIEGSLSFIDSNTALFPRRFYRSEQK